MEETEYTLQYEPETFKVIYDIISAEEVGICITDFNTGTILFVNNKMALYIDEADIESMIGKVCPVNEEINKELIDQHGNPRDPCISEQYIESMDIWLKIINQVVEWTNGRLVRMVVLYDITETKRMREQLTDFNYKDRLLGLKNEASLEKDIREAPAKPSLILFQVASLQKINEFHGWEKGNHLLCTIRDAILSKNVANSQLYRISKDKFCLAVKNISRSELKKLAYDMSDMFSGIWKVEYEGTTFQSFNDVVIAVIPCRYIRGNESVLSMGERMLAKARERKKVVIYNRKMDEAHKNHLKMEWNLIKCVHENMRGFNIFYQPIINSDNETWCGLEALCRWDTPELGPIPPAVFIPEAERLELIETLGLWVLETAVSRCKEWKLDYCENFILNVNISAIQFQNETLAYEIINILKQYDFPGEKLCLEITESTRVTFLDRSLRSIEQLRQYNILVALDDFGTGYSSFSRLRNMPVDIVKIERMFVSEIEDDEYHRYLFRAMINLAHAANMKLIAEGVERKRQMNILVKEGADYLQGYLFSKPLSPRDLENELIHFVQPNADGNTGSCLIRHGNIGNAAV